MSLSVGGLPWFGIALATLAYYLLGAVWFTPLFGRAWDAALGHTRESNSRFAPRYYVVPLISCLVVTTATAMLAYALDLDRISDALVLGSIVGLGYAASVTLTNAVTPTTPRPWLFAIVTGGYHLVGCLIVATIVAAL